MSVMADVYNIIIRRDAAYVSSLIRKFDVIDYDNFYSLVHTLDQSLDD